MLRRHGLRLFPRRRRPDGRLGHRVQDPQPGAAALRRRGGGLLADPGIQRAVAARPPQGEGACPVGRDGCLRAACRSSPCSAEVFIWLYYHFVATHDGARLKLALTGRDAAVHGPDLRRRDPRGHPERPPALRRPGRGARAAERIPDRRPVRRQLGPRAAAAHAGVRRVGGRRAGGLGADWRSSCRRCRDTAFTCVRRGTSGPRPSGGCFS